MSGFHFWIFGPIVGVDFVSIMNSLEKSKFSFRDEEKIKVRKTTWNSLSLYILSNQIIFYLVSLPSKWQKRFVRIASLQFTRHISMSKVFFSLFIPWLKSCFFHFTGSDLPASQPASPAPGDNPSPTRPFADFVISWFFSQTHTCVKISLRYKPDKRQGGSSGSEINQAGQKNLAISF